MLLLMLLLLLLLLLLLSALCFTQQLFLSHTLSGQLLLLTTLLQSQLPQTILLFLQMAGSDCVNWLPRMLRGAFLQRWHLRCQVTTARCWLWHLFFVVIIPSKLLCSPLKLSFQPQCLETFLLSACPVWQRLQLLQFLISHLAHFLQSLEAPHLFFFSFPG